MLFPNGLIDMGVAIFVIIALAEVAKLKRKSERGYGWLAIAGLCFLFAGVIGVIPTTVPFVRDLFLTEIFSFFGWILAIIGTIFIGYESLLER